MGGLLTLGRDLTHKIRRSAKLALSLTREGTAGLLSFELYPLGMVGDCLPVVRLPTSTHHTPILFLHGVLHNRSAFVYMIQKLALKGWQNFEQLNLFTSLHSIARMAEQTKRAVERVLSRYDASQVDIVAHSMGGIIARYFVQKLGGDTVVRNLVTLGTPHQGTKWFSYSILPQLRELRPESHTIRSLNALPVPVCTQVISISGSLDICIQPKQGAFWEGVRNIQLQGLGHAGLLFSRRVVRIIASRLGTS